MRAQVVFAIRSLVVKMAEEAAFADSPGGGIDFANSNSCINHVVRGWIGSRNRQLARIEVDFLVAVDLSNVDLAGRHVNAQIRSPRYLDANAQPGVVDWPMLHQQLAAGGDSGITQDDILRAIPAPIGNCARNANPFAIGPDHVQFRRARVDRQIGARVERSRNRLIAVTNDLSESRAGDQHQCRGCASTVELHGEVYADGRKTFPELHQRPNPEAKPARASDNALAKFRFYSHLRSNPPVRMRPAYPGKAMKSLSDPTRLKPIDKKEGLLQVIVETPAGSRNKFAYDPDQGIFTVKKVLPAGMVFPWDFGFLPQTIAPDGDPIDVLLLMDEPAFPGIAVRARLIGVIEGEQIGKEKGGGKRKNRNDRLVAVAEVAHRYAKIRRLKDLPHKWIEELENFFVNYHRLEGREYRLLGCKGADAATKLIEKARAAGRGR